MDLIKKFEEKHAETEEHNQKFLLQHRIKNKLGITKPFLAA